MLNKNFKGITLTELLVTAITSVMVLTVVLSAWYFTYKNWAIERIKTRLRTDLMVTMERIKEEMRLSSLNYTSFYPPSALEYTAINFPMATANAQGYFTVDSNWIIQWDKSIVYHIFENPPSSGKYELRRTEFTDNNTYLTNETNRNKQLSDLATYGEAQSSTPNKDKAATKVVCENIDEFKIRSDIKLFDGYSSVATRSEKIEFGTFRLDYGNDGYHDFKFEVVGKNEDSSGRKFGIDTLYITPCGYGREAEYYYPLSLPHTDSGGNPSKQYLSGCGGNYYLEYSSGAVGDYINLRLYYDLIRESDFTDTTRVNTLLAGLDPKIVLATPKESGMEFWSAVDEASSGREQVSINLSSEDDITIRNILSSGNIERAGHLVRVKFQDPNFDLTIHKAYIIERDTGDDGTGAGAQLYFSDPPLPIGASEPDTQGLKIGDDGGSASGQATINAGYYVFSNWAVFPIEEGKEYFVTAYLDNGVVGANHVDLTAWTGLEPNSYYVEGDMAGQAAWASSTASDNVYILESAHNWQNEGTVASVIYDTTVANSDYGVIRWEPAVQPAGQAVTVSVRSSDNADMSDATSWETVAASGSSLSTVDNKRYIEFRAVFSKTSNFDDYANYPSIDNVTIEWPGPTSICEIGGYFVQKPDYGIIKLTVDGRDLTKGLEFYMSASEEFQGKTYDVSLTAEIEPRNTGR